MAKLVMLAALALVAQGALSATLTNQDNKCRGKEWQCGDGTCIKSERKCDGVSDCPDKSDEAAQECKKQEGSAMCTLPKHPPHGTYSVQGISDATPGQSLVSVFLNVTCDPGYMAKGEQFLLCYEGNWSQNMTQCVRYCTLDPHPSVIYECIQDESNTGVKSTRECDIVVLSGTVVRPECRTPNYYHSGIHPYMRCIDGSWDYVAICTPECGTIAPKGEELIANGHHALRGELPWHVAIYSKGTTPFRYLCGGSIISATAVVTAAHCVWSEEKNMKLPESSFAVAAGKQYRIWSEILDKEFAQKRDVKSIEVPPRFQGTKANLQEDIAVIIVTKPFEFKTNIRPACVNFDFKFNQNQLSRGNSGMIGGWGLTENGNLSHILQIVTVPYMDINECLKILPFEFTRYITSDKICAGYTNGTAMCTGDSGGGLAFPEFDRGIARYYLRGVLSVAPNSEEFCHLNSPSGYTEIIKHQQFIQESLTSQTTEKPDITVLPENTDQQENIEEHNQCVLPAYPAHGTYKVKQNVNAKPGLSMRALDLDVNCDPGYTLKGSSLVTCANGLWWTEMPQCVRSCILKSNPSVDFRCIASSTDDFIKQCEQLQPTGAVVKPICRIRYYSPGALPLMRCIDGTWDYVAVCVEDCGTIKKDNSSESKQREEFNLLPWSAVIYTKLSMPYKQICTGTIVNPTTILTAAHCVWRQTNKPSDYAVAVGKLYHNWTHPGDRYVQKSDVTSIKVPNRYQGSASNYQDDIAVLILKTAIMYNLYVGPVCLDFDFNFNRRQLQPSAPGKMESWTTNDLKSQTSPRSITLRTIDLPYIPVEECIQNSPPQFREYITSDKICAGLSNGTLVCQGDGGGGLAFPELDKQTLRYYLRGVFSTGARNSAMEVGDSCFVFPTITFTEVVKHEHFIRENIQTVTNQVSDDSGEELEKKDAVDSCKEGEQFRCSSGACISISDKCNDVNDCADGSDESIDLCGNSEATKSTTTTAAPVEDPGASSAQCLVPPQPDNGVYHIAGGPVVDGKASFLFLSYTCYKRFSMKLGVDPKVFCGNGIWSTDTMPKCLQTCYLDRHESMNYNCIIDGTESTRPCRDHEVEGTVIQPSCKEPNYYTPLELPYMVCRRGGQWNVSPSCVPECGTLTPKGAPLVLGGDIAKYGDVPWHAGIYHKNKENGTHDQICGGSLISNSVILSAAHCFWDERKKRLYSVKNYAVAVGKLYRDWDNPKDEPHAQKSDLEKIVITQYYQGRDLNYRDDIAVVIVSGPFQYQTYVRPVCLDFRHDFAESQLQTGVIGKASGWGLTTGYRGSESNELKVADMPFVSYVDCVRQTSPAFLQYITYDKICAGDVDGIVLCRGDSGGGLAFPVTVFNTERYYLRGIASTSPPTTDQMLCNAHALTGFTAISKYQNLIKTHWLT